MPAPDRSSADYGAPSAPPRRRHVQRDRSCIKGRSSLRPPDRRRPSLLRALRPPRSLCPSLTPRRPPPRSPWETRLPTSVAQSSDRVRRPIARGAPTIDGSQQLGLRHRYHSCVDPGHTHCLQPLRRGGHQRLPEHSRQAFEPGRSNGLHVAVAHIPHPTLCAIPAFDANPGAASPPHLGPEEALQSAPADMQKEARHPCSCTSSAKPHATPPPLATPQPPAMWPPTTPPDVQRQPTTPTAPPPRGVGPSAPAGVPTATPAIPETQLAAAPTSAASQQQHLRSQHSPLGATPPRHRKPKQRQRLRNTCRLRSNTPRPPRRPGNRLANALATRRRAFLRRRFTTPARLLGRTATTQESEWHE